MEKQLITIDYLILNLNGKLQKNIYDTNTSEEINAHAQYLDASADNIFFISNFCFELAERGTKNFSSRYTVFYNDIRLGILTANPHKGSVLKPDFAQLQIDNALFYTHRNELKKIIQEFLTITDYEWTAINRLDIALDKQDNGYYSHLYNKIMNGEILLAGRKKAVTQYAEMQLLNAHHETHKGQIYLNGFTVGKRSASRFLRVYNKTLNLRSEPKEYINTWWQNDGLASPENECDVWRYEYQLNAKFFKDLFKHKDIVTPTSLSNVEKLTWAIFDIENLIELLRLAEKNHFELRENTGKSQINKEEAITLHCWNTIKNTYTKVKSSIQKIPRIISRSSVILKRLAKSLFREYYVNGQDISYIIGLNQLLNTNTAYNPETQTERPLKDWFAEKMPYYLSEFHTKERIKDTFNKMLYHEHELLAI
ncbi:hypothetical protein [Flavobacterium coralii]|uniref:hypothetical protein n=1 Tax=Flavobacterium coralii TaxID=2838017 RepID=UPI000C470D26|nr:hypothetical protein [Flavobacterium sp.]|tara:strand:+ start:38369 stop:39640 length:1272 start_codon:yes stop_codon:yes gene_type:complete